MPQANEHGVYPYEDAETIIISCLGAYLEIHLLEIENGWIWGMDATYRCGSYSGFGNPLSVGRAPYHSREEAIGVALQRAIGHFDPDNLTGKPSPVNDSQRQAAADMVELIEKRIEMDNQQTLF